MNTLFKTTVLTCLALVAFAANSVLCRMALGGGAIDASGFTIIRLLSGSVVLLLIIGATQLRRIKEIQAKGSWSASLMLFIYAVSFSYAYISLDTGAGALILFGSVQITMIALAYISGTRLHSTEWIGVVLAFAGFVCLVLPGVSAPSLSGFLLMTISGIAWGSYTLRGHGSKDPLTDTAYNFFRTTPLIILLGLLTLDSSHYTVVGIVLAVLSGGVMSGIGYTIWYIALRDLSSIQAAVLQLSVPVIAALGGVVFVSESITSRLIISSILVLGGILLVIISKLKMVRSH